MEDVYLYEKSKEIGGVLLLLGFFLFSEDKSGLFILNAMDIMYPGAHQVTHCHGNSKRSRNKSSMRADNKSLMLHQSS